MNPDAWHTAFPIDALPPGSSRVFRHGRLQVAVFRLPDGTLRAVDNRCPHEGYPLAQGDVKVDQSDAKRCLLTCAWHNYKFDLTTGAAAIGEEAVRVFPVRVLDGQVQLDLTVPDPAAERARLRRSIEGGLLEWQMGRVARDVVRFLAVGGTPEAVALLGAAHDGARARWGTTHALPVLADALRLVDDLDGSRRALPLVQALDMAAVSNVRLPRRVRPAPLPGGGDAIEDARLVRALVEAEDGAAAEARFAGGRAQWGREWALRVLAGICADHLLSFGHGLIYVVKAAELLEACDRAGVDHADDEADVLCGLLHGLVCGTREDVLPAWRSTMALIDGRDLAVEHSVIESQSAPANRALIVENLAIALVEHSGANPAAAVLAALDDNASLDDVVMAMELASSRWLLWFDPAIDRDLGVQDGWLSVTHTLTRAHAARLAVDRGLLQGADLRRMLLLTARFVAHVRPLMLPEDRRHVPRPIAGTLDELNTAIDGHEAAQATDIALHLLHTCPGELERSLRARSWSDGATLPITVAHILKLTVAAFDVWRATDLAEPVLGLVRFLALLGRERRVTQRTLEAIALVDDGKVPKTLAN